MRVELALEAPHLRHGHRALLLDGYGLHAGPALAPDADEQDGDEEDEHCQHDQDAERIALQEIRHRHDRVEAEVALYERLRRHIIVVLMALHEPVPADVEFLCQLVQPVGIIATGLQADVAKRVLEHEVEMRRADVAAQVFRGDHEENVSLDCPRLRYDGLPDGEVLQAVGPQDKFSARMVRIP